MTPKDEADDPEDDYVKFDLQIIQRAMIVKAANFYDVNLDLFELAKTAFGNTSLWVHAKPSQCSRDRHQALKLIWSNQLGVHAIDKRNTNNHK